jgi:hypothetical protein
MLSLRSSYTPPLPQVELGGKLGQLGGGGAKPPLATGLTVHFIFIPI